MKSLLGPLVALVLFCSAAQAGPYLWPGHRVPNPALNGGYCAWASGETAALHAGFPQARGLLLSVVGRRYRWAHDGRSWGWRRCGAAHLSEVGNELRRRGVPIRHCSPGQDCRALIGWGTGRGLPVVVGLLIRPRVGHAVVALTYGDRTVVYYDPNHPDRLCSMTRASFNGKASLGVLVIGSY